MTPTNVFLAPDPNLGRAIHRVAHALIRHAPPWVEVVDTLEEADLHIVHALGNGQKLPMEAALAAGTLRPTAMIQYCLATTEQPDPRAWLDVWRASKLVWSYYNLGALLELETEGREGRDSFHFMHAPLGVDPAFQRDRAARPRLGMVLTSGYIAATEGVGEWDRVLARLSADAAHAQTAWGVHLGPALPETPPWRWHTFQNIPDTQLADLYAQVRYVAAMRRVEGFEFPGIEGLCSGARPVCFDQPHYRAHYLDHAEYVPEGSVEEVTEALLRLVRSPYRAVTPAEIDWARQRFDWAPIIGEFWQRLEGRI